MTLDDAAPAETASPPPDAPAPGDVPGGTAWFAGKFFPDACGETFSRWEIVPDAPAVRVRHLPLASEILLARMRFGKACEPLLADWRALWAAAVPEGLDAYARRIGWRGTLHDPDGRAARLATAERWLGSGVRSGAAGEAIAVLAPEPRPPAVRDSAFHVLEEASIHLGLARSGMPFALSVPADRARPDLWTSDGDGCLSLAVKRTMQASAYQNAVSSTRDANNPYWRMPAFRGRAGRGMALAIGADHVKAVLIDMAASGHRKAFLKAVAAKAGTWVVDLEGADAGSVWDRVGQAMGEDRARLGRGLPSMTKAILVQGFTPFVREHRFLVVGHRVVASTASDRALSVLDARGDRILADAVARLDRPAAGSGAYDRGAARTERDRALVARMARGARDLARALREDVGERCRPWEAPDCYCIDMGQAEDGRVLPIEVNSLLNCGLYAADYGRVARALARRAGRRAVQKAMLRTEAADAKHGLASVEHLVPRFVAAADRGGHVRTLKAFNERNRGAVEEFVDARAQRPMRPVDRARETAFFEPWRHAEWAGPWRAHLAESGRQALSRAAIGVRSFLPGPRTVDVHLPLWCAPGDIVAAVRSAGPDAWVELATHFSWWGGPPPIVVKALARAGDVDLEGTVMAHALAEDEDATPVRFRPWASLLVLEANGRWDDGTAVDHRIDIGDLCGAFLDPWTGRSPEGGGR